MLGQLTMEEWHQKKWNLEEWIEVMKGETELGGGVTPELRKTWRSVTRRNEMWRNITWNLENWNTILTEIIIICLPHFLLFLLLSIVYYSSGYSCCNLYYSTLYNYMCCVLSLYKYVVYIGFAKRGTNVFWNSEMCYEVKVTIKKMW